MTTTTDAAPRQPRLLMESSRPDGSGPACPPDRAGTNARTLTVAASDEPPLRIVARADLIVRPQDEPAGRVWVVKDPIRLKHFRLSEEDHFLMARLDGRTGLSTIVRQFEQQFPPQRIRPLDVQAFARRLVEQHLAIPLDADEVRRQADARRGEASRLAMTLLTGWLSPRLPAVRAGLVFGIAEDLLGWLFTRSAVIAVACLWAVVLAMAVARWDRIVTQWPDVDAILSADNAVYLAIALFVTKVLHEFGHAVACRRAGAECEELGIMFLVFFPVLYCDVTDVAVHPSRRQRMLVGLAGVWVELALAAACGLGWLTSRPGVFHAICLNVVCVSTVATLAINLNPLVRFDGYYILADWLGLPNLAEKSSRRWTRWLTVWVVGSIPIPPERHTLGQRAVLTAYAPLSWAWRVTMAVSIAWMLWSVLEPHGLGIVGQLGACVVLGTVGLGLILFFGRIGREAIMRRRVAGLRTTLLLATAGGVTYLAATWPIPSFVWAPALIEAPRSETLYVGTPGTIRHVHVRSGAIVEAGEPIAELDNPAAWLTLTSLASERSLTASRLEELARTRYADDKAEAEAERLKLTLAALDEQIVTRTAEVERLTIRASRSGRFHHPPAVWDEGRDDRLPTWHDVPLTEANLGANLDRGTVVGQITPLTSPRAVLAVRQQDLELIRHGAAAEVVLTSRPDMTLTGTVDERAELPVEDLPRTLSGRLGGPVPTVTTARGSEQPAETTYLVSVGFDPRAADSIDALAPGLTGQARVRLPDRTIATIAWRWARETFFFEL